MRLDPTIIAGLRELGVNDRLRAIDTDPSGMMRSYEERVRLFEDYKAELKKTHRAVALECHPDRTHDDPADVRARKEDRFKRITRAVDYVLQLRPRPAVRQPQRLVIVVGSPFVTTTTSGTGSTTTSSTGGVFIRW